MNEEEKKIKEMEELGISLIDSPSETIAKASPTKLKLQALTFMVIGKIERYFLSSMLKQAEEARIFATVVPEKEKETFTTKVDSSIAILEEKIEAFDENYRRVMGHGKRSLKLPSTNFVILALNKAVKQRRKEEMTGVVDAYKQMNDVFSASTDAFSKMDNHIKRNIEISKAEQDNIKKSVYEALSGTTDKEVEEFASKSNDKSDTKLDTAIDEMASKIIKSKDKEKELDNFFENISPIKKKAKLDDSTLDRVLNGGQAKDEAISPKPKETDNSNLILTGENPIFSSDSTGTVAFDGKSSIIAPDWMEKQESNAKSNKPKPLDDDIFKTASPISSSSEETTGTLPDVELEDFANRLTGSRVLLSHSERKGTSVDLNTESDTIASNIKDLGMQLKETITEMENKRQDKEKIKQECEAIIETCKQDEDDLSRSREENVKMQEEIERKRQEQKALQELNKQIEQALVCQRQIKANRQKILEETEATKKYMETMEQEKERQSRLAKEKEKVQSERANLQSETNEIDSNLREEREKLEAARRELYLLGALGEDTPNNSMNLSSKGGYTDINYDDYLAAFSTTTTEPKRRIVDTDYNGFYVNPPIQGRDEPTPKKR